MELRLPLEMSPGREAACRAVFGTHTHTKIYPILIQLIVKIYNLIAGVTGEGLQHYNTSPIRIVKNEKTGTSE